MSENRCYNTRARKYILEFLQKNSEITISVADILEYLLEQGVSVNFTTVYRYLNKLTRERRVIKISDEKGQRAVYQFVGNKNSCDEHIHIKCICCGRLEHIECELMQHIRSHLEDNHGFAIKCDGSILYGLCKECKKRN